MRTSDEIKLRAFNHLFPVIEPQSLNYQTKARATGYKLVMFAQYIGSEYLTEERMRSDLTTLRGKLTREKNKHPTGSLEASHIEGEIEAILWTLEEERR